MPVLQSKGKGVGAYPNMDFRFILCAMIIKSATYIISSPDHAQCPPPDHPEYAFIGRSNVGKSSLINMLCNDQKLAKTSSSPGKTQLINHFKVVSESKPAGGGGARAETLTWYLVDLPGYGYAKVSQSRRRNWQQMIEGYLRKRENLVTVFVLIDSRHKPQAIDLDFIDQLGAWQIPFSIVFTKTDKENQKEVSRHVQDFLQAMKKNWSSLPRHFVTSALKKTGRKQLLEYIEACNQDIFSR
jgi:GTP-binding protein